jgi:TonB family protein
MRHAWTILLVVAGVAASGVARAEEPADPIVDPIAGVYALDSDSKTLIGISALGHGRVSMTSSAGWDALGWLARGDFVGTWRAHGPGATKYGWLWFHPEPDHSITARFTDESGGEARTEKWRYGYPWDEGPAPPPPDSNDTPFPTYAETLPEAIVRVPPAYPDEARNQHVEGTVLVMALVGKDGGVHGTRLVHSIPGLDSAAVAAVRQWRFKPATSEGKSIAVWIAVPIKFSLH